MIVDKELENLAGHRKEGRVSFEIIAAVWGCTVGRTIWHTPPGKKGTVAPPRGHAGSPATPYIA